jgi:hypothetical protein
MAEQAKVDSRNVCAPELYHQIQRLVLDWSGEDACQQSRLLPQLLSDILHLVGGHTADAMRAAAHDDARAA